MSSKLFRKIALALAIAGAPALIGCGSGSDPGVPAPPGPPGFGNAVPVGQPGDGQPSAQIPFSAQNAQILNVAPNGAPARKLVAGQIPPNPYTPAGVYGQVQVGVGGVAPGMAAAAPGSAMLSGTGPYGTIQVNVVSMAQQQGVPYGQPGYGQPYANPYAPTPVTATGFIQMSSLAKQNMYDKVICGQIQIPGITGMGYCPTNPMGSGSFPYNMPFYGQPYGYSQPGYGQPYAQPQQPTAPLVVSQVALSLNISNSGQLYIGDVYLYLNNQQHGYVLEF